MKVAVLILNKSNNKLLFNCINSIKNNTKYENYHIYIGDTGSTPDELKEIKEFLKLNFKQKQNASLICFNYYNFSKNNNQLVEKYINDEDLLLFCNNDIELIDDCITEAVKIVEINKNNVGTIGFKLLFADNTIQHAGQLLYLDKNNNSFKHITHRGLKESFEKFSIRDVVIGNTGGLMMTEKELFLSIGGFNENYLECFEDVEYNIKCLLKNRTNIYIGDKKAFHFESQSRSKDDNMIKKLQTDAYYYLIPFINNNLQKISEKKLAIYI